MYSSLCSVVTRLYPVVPGNARITAENEIVVGDHLFPKQVRQILKCSLVNEEMCLFCLSRTICVHSL